MNRSILATHSLQPFQMYSVGAVKRETQNIFEFQGKAHVNYKSHAGQVIGELAYLDGNTPVHTCLAKDFCAWAQASLEPASAA